MSQSTNDLKANAREAVRESAAIIEADSKSLNSQS